MNPLLNTLYVLGEIEDEREEMGEDFQVFSDADPSDSEILMFLGPEKLKHIAESDCICPSCVHTRAALGRGRN